MPKKITHEDFVEQIKELYGDEYTILSEYKNSRTKIEVLHSKCNKTHMKSPDGLKRGKGCPHCADYTTEKSGREIKRRTHDDFVEEVYDLVGDEYTVIDTFSGMKKNTKMMHNECGNIISPKPEEFINRGTRCKFCSIKKMALSHDDFIEKLNEISNNEFEVMGDYVNNMTHILVKHKPCGQLFEPLPKNLLQGTSCPYCSGRRSNAETFQKKLKEEFGTEFELVGDYKNASTKVRLFHNRCGNIYEIEPIHLLGKQQRYCTHCTISSAEAKTGRVLDRLGIDYKTEYSFDDCKNRNTLHFDFAIFNNEELSFLIEVDGEQHYMPVNKFGGEDYLKYIQGNDKIKNEYCEENNIPLIRIPYWDFENLEEVLNKVLKQYELI